MELAKLTSKGQITIPLMIRNLLHLKTGDKVFFEEKNGKVYIANASQITLANVQTQMKGEAKKAGFESEDDVVAYIKETRLLSELQKGEDSAKEKGWIPSTDVKEKLYTKLPVKTKN